MAITLITGATSGIGEATARLLAVQNHSLILCGRNQETLQSLHAELSQLTKVTILNFDVSNLQQVNAAFDSLPKETVIDVLINNAGNAHGLATFQDGNINDFDQMIDTNLKGLIYATKACLPFLQKSQHPHIINISSIAGKEVYAKGNVYCASKAGVEALSHAMRIDFLELGIKVSNIAPGLVDTNFSKTRFKGNQDLASKVYEGIEPLVAKDIAETIVFVLSRPHHVQISDITILASAQASATIIKRN